MLDYRGCLKNTPLSHDQSLNHNAKTMSPVVVKRQPCEVYSRVCGYMRPTSNWNDAKKSEWSDKVKFSLKEE